MMDYLSTVSNARDKNLTSIHPRKAISTVVSEFYMDRTIYRTEILLYSSVSNFSLRFYYYNWYLINFFFFLKSSLIVTTI